VQDIQSLRETTVSRGGDPQFDWMRWRQPQQAILEMLSLKAREALEAAGVKLKIIAPGSTPSYSPFDIPFIADKTVSIPSGLGANEIRHELTHAGLDVASDLFPQMNPAQVFANTALGTFMGQKNIGWNAADQMKAAEEPAITMGGAGAYPGFTPSNVPQDFSNFFNTQVASWQYPTRPGWNIGR